MAGNSTEMRFMTGDSELFLIDTNILVYSYDKDEPSKRSKAEELLSKCFSGDVPLAISNQNLAEFVYVTTRKSKLSFDRAMVNVNDISNSKNFMKLNYDADTIILAIKIASEFKTPFWDSLLAATMKENGIFNIYTENVNDFKMPWIKAVNPLK